MKIKVTDISIRSIWDVQKAIELLEIQGLDGSVLKSEQYHTLVNYVTRFIWECIKVQCPTIEKFCTGKTGGFNLCEPRNNGTPIISINGHFYMQLITESSRNCWNWQSIDLNNVYRFNFNHYKYLFDLIKSAIVEVEHEEETMVMYKERTTRLLESMKPFLDAEPHFETINAKISGLASVALGA